jgi:hypothetical protein
LTKPGAQGDILSGVNTVMYRTVLEKQGILAHIIWGGGGYKKAERKGENEKEKGIKRNKKG